MVAEGNADKVGNHKNWGLSLVFVRRVRRVLRLCEHMLAVAGALFIIYHVGFDVSVMTSGSMSPTRRGNDARSGDRILTERFTYWFRKPHRWEVITFQTDAGLQVMKRVVGLPGETVSMQKDGTILINGVAAERPASLRSIRYYALGNLHRGAPVKCEQGHYVLGDDSADIEDSRYEGPVKPDQIADRAWLVLWPMGYMRSLNP